ncbi:tryptophan synthase subunit alpha [Brevibacillus massiliensis]|jgi:tryptophan synthase alpha chain|uniref:tryptophan synthase subunit alpha n=1 Tax=Brevibacillus massiliensis TaxID=1118054 RepID=UPI0002D397F6|nr:tryptophan synthase subunit alpha [Brevibacillus massiliensis]
MSGVKNRIDELFAEREKKRFIPFITTGDPSLGTSVRLIHALIEGGADLIELGVPYSDPLADGPVIQRASQRALQAGTTIQHVLEVIKELRDSGVTIPLVLFTYYNPVLQYGVGRLFERLAECGGDGIIIPDLPYEENQEALAAANQNGLHLISLVAPTSDQRIAMIGEQASGFLYCVSSLGVTGTRSGLNSNLVPFLKRVRSCTSVPLGVGFGISTPDQVREVARHAEGVIVGSAIVKEIERNLPLLEKPETVEEGIAKVKTFVQTLSSALK